MARIDRTTTLTERVEIGERWASGQNDPEIARAMGLRVSTVRKWRRKYKKEGRAGVALKMGRPATGALGQFPLEVRDRIRDMRKEHPGWGPLTIRTEMEDMVYFSGLKLPSRPRIAAFLKQEGLTRRYNRHSQLPQSQATDPQQAHEVWEMDAQGAVKIVGLGSVSVINIVDLFSRLKVDSLPCVKVTHPSTEYYQLVLRRAFVKYGMPKKVSLDHDGVFYDQASASPFPSTLHLWFIALGVEVQFIEKRPPVEHAVIERGHQTVAQQAFVGQSFDDGDVVALQESLTDRLDFLNTRFPSRSLGGQPPLVAHPEARHSGKPYRLEWEEAMLDMQRVYEYVERGRWFRRVSSVGQFSIGGQRYRANKFANQTVEITFSAHNLEFTCVSEDGQQEVRLPMKGLAKADLMGELSPLLSQPVYQLALPFSQDTWREMMLANDLTGTTL